MENRWHVCPGGFVVRTDGHQRHLENKLQPGLEALCFASTRSREKRRAPVTKIVNAPPMIEIFFRKLLYWPICWVSASRQLFEQCLGLLQFKRMETLGEPAETHCRETLDAMQGGDSGAAGSRSGYDPFTAGCRTLRMAAHWGRPEVTDQQPIRRD
jgi:hypothetical protein